MILRTVALFLLRISFKGDDFVAVIYTTLIVKGYKKYSEVPDVIKLEVKRQLEALDLGHLAE